MLKICYDSYLIVAGDFNSHEKPLNNLFSFNDKELQLMSVNLKISKENLRLIGS